MVGKFKKIAKNLPQCLKHVYAIYKHVKKWARNSGRSKSAGPITINGDLRHQSPFEMPFAGYLRQSQSS